MGVAQKRMRAAEYTTPAMNFTDNKRRILFPRMAGAASEKHGAPADKALEVNKALVTSKVLAVLRISRLSYNEKGNLSVLMGGAATSRMILP